ncbi:DUF4439 domain-containing protein [Glycomyces albidus]|jgi:hypothetical protein|uniref:DUF4439 domain-containing protein n=1 Tax=Glycomyces albidus TaxID=2656774 RepID=A0A6L5GFG6_9ACTN|nr:DUF4439 domain-containing protein [Glycomyces albidus]MQM28464.1 DUF4439 domain-containing protein [Glycomyces albidus]
MSAVDAGLAAEYAAIFAYSAAAVRLDGDPRTLAEALESEHRSRRDTLLDHYAATGTDAPAPAPGYDVGVIADAAAAQELLTGVELNVTATWRAGVAATDPVERRLCLDMYAASAVSLARWRLAIGQAVADPWPGRPE